MISRGVAASRLAANGGASSRTIGMGMETYHIAKPIQLAVWLSALSEPNLQLAPAYFSIASS